MTTLRQRPFTPNDAKPKEVRGSASLSFSLIGWPHLDHDAVYVNKSFSLKLGFLLLTYFLPIAYALYYSKTYTWIILLKFNKRIVHPQPKSLL